MSVPLVDFLTAKLANMHGLLQEHARDRTKLALWQAKMDWKRPVEGLKESFRLCPGREAWVGRIGAELRVTDEQALARLGDYFECFTQVLADPMPASPRHAGADAGRGGEGRRR